MIVTRRFSECSTIFLQIPDTLPWKVMVTDLTNLDDNDYSEFAVVLHVRDVEEILISTEDLLICPKENWEDEVWSFFNNLAKDISVAIANAIKEGKDVLDIDEVIDECQKFWKEFQTTVTWTIP